MNITHHKIVCPQAKKSIIESKTLDLSNDWDYLAETVFSAISPGTELAWFGDAPNTHANYPYYPGYSMVAKVLKSNQENLPLQPGDYFVCRKTHQSHFTILSHELRALPQGISLEEASAYRLASIALAGVRKAKIQIGAKVAVLGLGPIGNFASQFAQINGASQVVGIDLDPKRLKIAKACGIEKTTSEITDLENTFDTVIEATGSPQPILTAFSLAKKQGTVILLATTRESTPSVDFTNLVHRKMITIVGAHESFRSLDDDDFEQYRSHRFDDETVLEFLRMGRLKIQPLLGQQHSPENIQTLYSSLMSKEIDEMIPLLDWSSYQS